MSIAIALGVTTPETSYSDMAAGSDPESVEASPAVNEKNYPNHSCGSAQNQGYRGLPYADHNYGAPPPPTPPASPLSQTIIPRVELNGVTRSRYDDGADNSVDSDSSSDEDGGVAGWCHCSLMQGGFLLKCDTCRGLDRRKGNEAQRRKPENVSVGESSGTESGEEEVSPSTVSYTATQHTPTSITLTVNRLKPNKPKKRKKSTDKARAAPKAKKVKAFREGSRKSMRMKNSTTEASTLDENTAEGWESKIRQWTDQYEEALANQYSADVQTLLQLQRSGAKAGAASADNINRTELACNNTVIGSQMQLQLGRVTRVQKHRKILRAARDLDPDTLIIEYRGKVMLQQQFEVNGHFFKKPYPFVLFYSKFNEVEMCVDARTFGNDARFIRRSCTPNAEVRHMMAEGMVHLCIYAVTRILKDSEVTIGFDYQFSSCNYKVDCACHKGNQNCPVQKHNLNPPVPVLPPPSLPSLTGAETRRRKARRKELESGAQGSVSDDSSQPPEEPADGKELRGGSLGASDAEEGLCDGLKLEEGEDAELDDNEALSHSRRTREDRKVEAIMHVFENMEKRRKRTSQGQDRSLSGVSVAAEEPKRAAPEGEGRGSPPTQSSGAGVSTRRASYVTELPPMEVEKASPIPPAPKPPPARTSKPRPKSRMSRYRSSSSQRARRQRQALAQQAVDQGQSAPEDGSLGPSGAELGMGEGALGGGQPLDPDGQGGPASGPQGNKANLRYPKTKKYLVTEWLNDKVLEKPECPIDRPLRITTDLTVLATTLNMLPGLSHSPLICTTPKHYVRFGSPFTPERRRRPVILDGSYGSFKKRWIRQAQEEKMSSASVEDGTESSSSHQSNSSSSTPNHFKAAMTAPLKKRISKCASEPLPLPSEELLRPLSPITPPLPSDPLHPLRAASYTLILGAEDQQHNGLLLPYSPLRSLPTSRCNTPLQFENISSPEASPVHRSESLSPEPCLRADFDGLQMAPPPDLSLPSSLESPALSSSAALEECSAPAQDLPPGADPPLGTATREQAFRTEFNLIYTCSPLNANLGEGLSGRGSVNERLLSQPEGGFSPGSLSPYAEPHFGTPPHPSHPPQKKKVSLLEYRKRKQVVKDPEVGGSLVTICSSASVVETPGCLRSTLQPPASPLSCFSSPAHPSFPHMEEVSPPDHAMASQHPGSQPRAQESTSHWMVPTSVERLREGQGALERVLRGSLKMERALKRTEGGAGDGCRDKEAGVTDGEKFEIKAVSRTGASPVTSPQRYSHSPSVYPHQVQSLMPETHQKMEHSAFLLQSASSPFRGAPVPGQGYYAHLSSHPPLTQTSLACSAAVCTSGDSPQCLTSGPAGGDHQSGSSGGTVGVEGSQFYSGSHLKSANASSRSPLLAQNNPKTEVCASMANPVSNISRLSQQPGVRTLSPDSHGQTVLQTGTRLLSASNSQHYPQRGAPIGQIQGSGVRTQSGSC